MGMKEWFPSMFMQMVTSECLRLAIRAIMIPVSSITEIVHVAFLQTQDYLIFCLNLQHTQYAPCIAAAALILLDIQRRTCSYRSS
jgi:hypothetical protein